MKKSSCEAPLSIQILSHLVAHSPSLTSLREKVFHSVIINKAILDKTHAPKHYYQTFVPDNRRWKHSCHLLEHKEQDKALSMEPLHTNNHA